MNMKSAIIFMEKRKKMEPIDSCTRSSWSSDRQMTPAPPRNERTSTHTPTHPHTLTHTPVSEVINVDAHDGPTGCSE